MLYSVLLIRYCSSYGSGDNTTTSSSSSNAQPPTSLSLTRSPNHHTNGTSTYSMSLGLAKELHERSLSPRGAMANPPRFPVISAETRASDAGASHATPAYTNASLFVSPLPGINDGAATSPMRYRPENAYLNLVDKIKDIGFKSILNIAEDSHIMPSSPSKDSVDVGLNSVMFMKRHSLQFRRRSGKFIPKSSVVTSILTPVTVNNKTSGDRVSNGIYQISPPSNNAQFAQLPDYMCPVPGSAPLAQGGHVSITSSSSSLGGAAAATTNTPNSSNGSVTSIPSLAELKSSKDSRQPLSSILETPILEGIATRVGLGAAAAGLTATPKFFPKKSKKS